MSTSTGLSNGIDRDTLRHLSRRSNARGVLQLGMHMGMLTASSALIAVSRGHYWLPAALVLQGVVLDFLFCALHETIHRTAFASRRVNDVVASICGAVLLLPPHYFRLFHFAHHRFTQNPAHDPELVQPGPTSLWAYVWRASGLPNWRKRLSITLRHAAGVVQEPFVPPLQRAVIVREARILWLCYAGVLVVSLVEHQADALIYWVIPVILGQPFLRLYLLSEHAGCAMNGDTYTNTRTTYTNVAVRLLTWQMPFHVEHHTFPSVPFHALKRVNALIRDRIEVGAPGYLATHRAFIRRMRADPGKVL